MGLCYPECMCVLMSPASSSSRASHLLQMEPPKWGPFMSATCWPPSLHLFLRFFFPLIYLGGHQLQVSSSQTPLLQPYLSQRIAGEAGPFTAPGCPVLEHRTPSLEGSQAYSWSSTLAQDAASPLRLLSCRTPGREGHSGQRL